MKPRLFAAVIFMVFGVFVLCSEGSALEIGTFNGSFYDGFETESFATNGWVVYGSGDDWEIKNDNPFNGTFNAEVKDTDGESYLEVNVSTLNYTSVNVSYYRQVQNFDAGEYFLAQWFNGTSYVTIENSSTGSGYFSRMFRLNESANNNSRFTLRFICSNNHASEKCMVDDVYIFGKLIDIVKPVIVNLTSSPESQVVYSKIVVYYFNVSIIDDNIGVVLFDLNGLNFTAARINSYYTVNFTGLGAGNHSFRWFANDSFGNFNWSNSQSYVVNKSYGVVDLRLNSFASNITINASQIVNISGYLNDGDGLLELYVDDALNSTSSTGTTVSVDVNFSTVGEHTANLTYSGNENYTSASVKYTIIVNSESQSQTGPGSTVTPADDRASDTGFSDLRKPGAEDRLVALSPQGEVGRGRETGKEEASGPERTGEAVVQQEGGAGITGAVPITGSAVGPKEKKYAGWWLLALIAIIANGIFAIRHIYKHHRRMIKRKADKLKKYRVRILQGLGQEISRLDEKRVKMVLSDVEKREGSDKLSAYSESIKEFFTKRMDTRPVKETKFSARELRVLFPETLGKADPRALKSSVTIVPSIKFKYNSRERYTQEEALRELFKDRDNSNRGLAKSESDYSRLADEITLTPERKINKVNKANKDDIIKSLREVYQVEQS